MRRIAVIREPGVFDAWGAAMLLGEALGLPAVNVSDLCRAAVHGGTASGQRLAAHMEAGELVPDDVLVEIVADTLVGLPYGWVLFGLPRTVRHAELLVEQRHAPTLVIEVMLDEDRIDQDWRLAATRWQLPVILAEYRLRMAPVQAFYRDLDAFRMLRESASAERLAVDLQAIVSGALA